MEEDSPPIEHENPFRVAFSGYIGDSSPVIKVLSEIERTKETIADDEGMKRRKRPDSLTVLPKSARSRSKIQSKMVRRMAKEKKHHYDSSKDNDSHQEYSQSGAIQIRQDNDLPRLENNTKMRRKALAKMGGIERNDEHSNNDGTENYPPYKLAAKQNIIKRRFFQKKSPESKREVDPFQIKYEKLKSQTNLAGCYGNFMKEYFNAKKEVKASERLRLLSRIPDTQLIIYKMLPNPKSENLLPTYSEPSDKYSIEYLWNIGASIQRDRRARIRCF